MRYLIHQRVSTDNQVIDSQEHHCLEYVKRLDPKAKPVIFSEPDVTTRIKMNKREVLMQLLDEVEQGDLVVVSALDRFSRDIEEMVVICRHIRRRGAEFYSLAQQSPPDWQLGIYGSVAQLERETVSRRVKSHAAYLKDKQERFGYIPYGYMLKEPIKRTEHNKGISIKVIENPDEQATLKEMQALRDQGFSYRRLADILNERGYRNRTGNHNEDGKWSYRAVARILTNRRSSEHKV